MLIEQTQEGQNVIMAVREQAISGRRTYKCVLKGHQGGGISGKKKEEKQLQVSSQIVRHLVPTTL